MISKSKDQPFMKRAPPCKVWWDLRKLNTSAEIVAGSENLWDYKLAPVGFGGLKLTNSIVVEVIPDIRANN